jgi:hypothetical protein
MPGYRLIEERMLKPFNPDGIEPYANCKGFLDYLRELRQDSFSFPPGYKLRVEGLDDVLLAAGDRLQEVEGFIHDVLASRANNLYSIMGTDVQIIFHHKLQKADNFWFDTGLKRVNLRQIFGSSSRHSGPNGTEFFIAGFNLT